MLSFISGKVKNIECICLTGLIGLLCLLMAPRVDPRWMARIHAKRDGFVSKEMNSDDEFLRKMIQTPYRKETAKNMSL